MPQEYNTKDIRHITAYAIKDSINLEARSIRFIVSSDKVDRDREIVQVKAVADAISAFGENPVFMAAHIHRTLTAVPTVIGSWDTDTFKALAHHSEMTAVFSTTTLAEEYWKNYSSRHQRAVSIGFIPIEGHEENSQKNGRIYVHTKIELIEISAVAVGACRDALSKELAMEANLESAVKAFLEEKMKEQLRLFEDHFDEIKMLITGAAGYADHLLGDDPELPGPDEKSEDSVLNRLNNLINEQE